VSAHFSPSGGCTDVIVREIAAARREILVLAYGFTSRAIAQALVDAKFRGVHLEVVLDHSNEKDERSDLHFLLEQKVTPLIDAHHAIAHNKVMLIDGKTLLTGSFNFTQAAETHNAENLVVIKGHPELISAYRQDFDHHKAHARAVELGDVQHAPAADHRHTRTPAKHEDVLAAAAHGTTQSPYEEDEGKEGANRPVTTLAAAELFARLRKETHGKDSSSKAA
jgi:phosphatidylserine/phosphatidylglycerophosphate/cardiolipin synthase-like enzyme